MPRRAITKKRAIECDSVYHDLTVAKFINNLMQCGEKVTAEKIFYGAMEQIHTQKGDELKVLMEAIENVTPKTEVRSRRVGGATYQVPTNVSEVRGTALAIRWLIRAATARKKSTMQDRLAQEILDATASMGAAFKKREDAHKMAKANLAFAHYRW